MVSARTRLQNSRPRAKIFWRECGEERLGAHFGTVNLFRNWNLPEESCFQMPQKEGGPPVSEPVRKNSLTIEDQGQCEPPSLLAVAISPGSFSETMLSPSLMVEPGLDMLFWISSLVR